MRLRFDLADDGDAEAYQATRTRLGEEMAAWVAQQGRDPALVLDAQLAMDWRVYYSHGHLDRWEPEDAEEFLCSWCPAKVAADVEGMRAIPDGLIAFVELLAERGQLRGGWPAAARLTAAVEELRPAYHEVIADPSTFGMGTSLFAATAPGGSLDGLDALDLSDPDAMGALIEQFNALPDAERDRILGATPLFGHDASSVDLGLGLDAGDGMAAMSRMFASLAGPVLPHRAPTPESVVASAEASPLRQKVEGLRTYLGEKGRVLTGTGNLKLADGRELVELLDTGDVPDRQHGDWTRTLRSSAELRWLNLVVDAATSAGAVRRQKNRLVPVKAWDSRRVGEQAVALAAAVLDIGAHTLGWRRDDTSAWSAIDELHDEAAPHLLAPGLAPGVVLELETLIDHTVDLLDDHVGPMVRRFYRTDEDLHNMAERDVARTMAALELAGLVEWQGSRIVADRYGFQRRLGGHVRVTPLGHAVVMPRLAAEGYRFEPMPSPAGMSGAEILGLVVEVVGSSVELLLLPAEAVDADPDDSTTVSTGEEVRRPPSPLRAELVSDFGREVADDTRAVLRAQRQMVGELLAEWQGERSATEAAAELVAAILEGGGAHERVAALALCGLLGAGAEPPVRALLDGPLGGHAVLWLTTHTDADPDELTDHVTLAPVVDTLALTATDPEADLREVAERFDLMVDADQRLDTLAAMWRLPLAEVADVLDALGKVHPDKAVAKAARKAAMQHRSAHPRR